MTLGGGDGRRLKTSFVVLVVNEGCLAVFDKCMKNKKVKSKNLKENRVPGAATELREELSITHPLPKAPTPHLTPVDGPDMASLGPSGSHVLFAESVLLSGG